MAAPFPSPTKAWHDNTYEALSPTRPELSAKGKNVLITGGGTGIGAETARYFAKAGASRIAILGRREKPLLDTKASIEQQSPETKVFAIPTDITRSNEVNAAFAEFAKQGQIHVVVSNAAIVGPHPSLKDADAELFANAVHQNLKGSVFVAQAFLRHASSDAVAIDVNSAGAHLNFTTNFASYSVSKIAIYRLWDTVAFSNPHLSVFHVQPGVVATEMNDEAGGVAATGIEDHVSLPASFHVWLASPEARFLKGKFLFANWDIDELKAQSKELEGNNRLKIDLVGWPFDKDDFQLDWKH